MTNWIRTGLLSGLIALAGASQAQVTGGVHAFEFLRMPQSPHLSALGGINVANPMQDISLALQNPALMRPYLHNQLSLAFNSYYAGISVANLAYGWHSETIKTSFLLGVQYLNYGSFDATDNIGNVIGSFRATDYAVSVGASRQYGERWRYGATLKFANSSFADKVAAGVLADVGITYTDTANLLVIGAVAKNMGTMVATYGGVGQEPMPFDLQLGISKRFAHLPLRVFATVHHLYEWNIRYSNPADIQTSTLLGTADSSELTDSHFADKLFRHLIVGAELNLGKRITVGLAYNHLNRGELAITEKKGMAGFSFGATVNLNKFQISYARRYYHIAGAYNEFGLQMNLGQLTGIGKSTERIGWNTVYTEPEM